MGRQVIMSEVRDPRLVTVRRGGALKDADHRLLAAWAADCARRPRRAIDLARAWVRGEITGTQARTAAFAANAAAREVSGAARVPHGSAAMAVVATRHRDSTGAR